MVAEDEQLRLLSEARKSAERKSEEQISEMRILEMRRKEELMRHRRDSLSSVDSLEDSRRDDYAEYSRASDSHSKYSAEDTLKVDAKSELDDGEIVDSLIQRWTLPPAPSATPAPQLAPTPSGRHSRRSSRSPRRKECDVMFNKGDIMYKCHTCAADDYKVFCDDCFNPRYHRGHDIESKKSQHPGDYCDCGHKNAVKREMVCDLHGTIRPDD
ncbi:hypothetical protein GQ53DRAFT_347374 [Thozetella sp. PMI_491]|nr:hypothetical protein GQ53DRAFT_347374 [Thozetella sp. PMI_491]